MGRLRDWRWQRRVRRVMRRDHVWTKALRLGVFLAGTVALAWLSYTFLESPFLRLGRSAPAPQKENQEHSPALRPHLVPAKALGTTSPARRQSTA